MLHSHSPLPREPFHLKQSVVETVRTLPTTIIYMAAATLVSSLMFHFTDNLINVSIVYILAIIFMPALPAATAQALSLPCTVSLGKLCLLCALHEAEFYSQRLSPYLFRDGIYLLFYQQHLHHDFPPDKSDP